MARQARRGTFGTGWVRNGRLGMAHHGEARRGGAGTEGLGNAWWREGWQGRQGAARRVSDRFGKAGNLGETHETGA